MLESNLEYILNTLSKIGSRAPGSWQELETAKFIDKQLKCFNYDSKIQIFDAASHNATDAFLEVEGKNFSVLPSQFSVSGEAQGELIYLGNCSNPFNYKDNYKGKIGLIFPSESLEKRLKFILELEANGISALIIIGNNKDNIETKLLRFEQIKTIPIITCSWDTGNKLAQLTGRQAKLKVEWCKNPRNNKSQNVIAALPGDGPYWMTVSAHHDTAPYAPGIMDNGGGTSMLIELAHYFADKKLPATIYFVSTGSEENGGLDMTGAGAKEFYKNVKEDLENCIAHLEIDDIGNTLGIPQIYYKGNKNFTDLIFDEKIKTCYNVLEKNFYSCDNGAAAKKALPFVWFTDAIAIPRPWYHTPDDNEEKMCIEKLAGHFDHIRTCIEKLAYSKPFYPYIRKQDFLIRPALYEDRQAVQEITQIAFEPVSIGKMSENYFNDELGGLSWHQYKNREIINCFENNLDHIIICEKEDKVVGYATYFYDKEKKIAEIGNNAVLPKFQGQGIGKLMQREVARRMEEDGFERFKVQTLSCDISAQKVYEKLGYERITENIIYLKGNKNV